MRSERFKMLIENRISDTHVLYPLPNLKHPHKTPISFIYINPSQNLKMRRSIGEQITEERTQNNRGAFHIKRAKKRDPQNKK